MVPSALKSKAKLPSPSCIATALFAARLKEEVDTPSILWCVYAQSLVKGTFCMNAFIWSLVCPDTGIASASSRALAFYSTTLTGADSHSCVVQGISETFSATGTESVSIYRAPMRQHDPKAELAGNMRHFCKVSAWAFACSELPKMQSGLLSAEQLLLCLTNF